MASVARDAAGAHDDVTVWHMVMSPVGTAALLLALSISCHDSATVALRHKVALLFLFFLVYHPFSPPNGKCPIRSFSRTPKGAAHIVHWIKKGNNKNTFKCDLLTS